MSKPTLPEFYSSMVAIWQALCTQYSMLTLHAVCKASSASSIDTASGTISTGILKTPLAWPVYVHTYGLEGDHIINTKYHGGPDQAIYVYTLEDYAWFAQHHNIQPHAGLFGENLLVEGFESADIAVGTQLKFGQVLLEATDPRMPCNTFAAKLGRSEVWRSEFIQAKRPGVYCRVLQAGWLAKEGSLQAPAVAHPTMAQIVSFWKDQTPNAHSDFAKALLAAPISERSRSELLELLTQPS